MRTLLCSLALLALPVFAVDRNDNQDRSFRYERRADAREWRQYRENFHREQRQLSRELARERRDQMREQFRQHRELRQAQRDFSREHNRFHWHDRD